MAETPKGPFFIDREGVGFGMVAGEKVYRRYSSNPDRGRFPRVVVFPDDNGVGIRAKPEDGGRVFVRLDKTRLIFPPTNPEENDVFYDISERFATIIRAYFRGLMRQDPKTMLPPVVITEENGVKKGETDSPKDEEMSGGSRRRSRRRLMSKKYCKRTPCRKMGFTQKASCRPYKNCYRKTRRRLK